MKRSHRALLSVAGAVSMVLITVGAYEAGRRDVALAETAATSQNCSVETLKGRYSMAGEGFAGRVPLAFVGMLEFDGAGSFSGHHREIIGGSYDTSTEAGDYSIEPDCTGITHWTDHPPHSGLPPHNHTIALVVSDGGNVVDFLGIDTSPPGQQHTDIPEPEIEFWGTLTKM